MLSYSVSRRPTVAEYVDFLSRTDLGSEYPRKAFLDRLEKLLAKVDVCATAWDGESKLVGVCMGLTDFVYFLFLTDLGVDRDHLRQGIGRELLRLAHEEAGGPEDICGVTWASNEALEFYADSSWRPRPALVARAASDWDCFTVRDPEAVLRGDLGSKP